MSINDIEELKDIALKLDKIRTYSPEDYFYLKGWIHHSVSQKERDGIVSVHERLERYQQEIKEYNSDRTAQHEFRQEER